MIVWDGLVTFLILKGIGLFMKLRMTEAELASGDIQVHGEVAYPMEEPEAYADFGDIPGGPVPEHHHHHELVTADGKVLVTSGGKAVNGNAPGEEDSDEPG